MKTDNGKRGNVAAQKRRRKARMRQNPKRSEHAVMLIDGNMSFYPAAWCAYRKAFLTQGLIETHKCRKIACGALKEVNEC